MKLEERSKLKLTGIYLIKNTITGHCYVGQAKNIERRIYYHLLSTIDEKRKDYNYPLHKAMRKYGYDAFELELLEECDYSKLNNREQYWVKQYDSRKNGYNQTDGGYQSIRHIKLTEEQVSEIKKLLHENNLTNAELSIKFNISKDMVHRINTGKVWFDSKIIYPIRVAPRDRVNHFNGTCIYKIKVVDNQVLGIFPSLSLAAKSITKTDKCRSSDSVAGAISRCCRGIKKTAYGYKWQKKKISKEDWLKLIY